MSEYNIAVTQLRTNNVIERHGPFYVEQRALRAAQRISRMYTSPDIVAVIITDHAVRGYPRAYRMGRLYKL